MLPPTDPTASTDPEAPRRERTLGIAGFVCGGGPSLAALVLLGASIGLRNSYGTAASGALAVLDGLGLLSLALAILLAPISVVIALRLRTHRHGDTVARGLAAMGAVWGTTILVLMALTGLVLTLR